MSDLTVDTAGSEGVLFNRKPLQNTCPALEQALAIVPLKAVFAFALGKERERGDPRPLPWLCPHEETVPLVSLSAKFECPQSALNH